jgi:hypothetical protein
MPSQSFQNSQTLGQFFEPLYDSNPNIMLSAAIYNKFGRHIERVSGNALLVSLLHLE